MSATIIVRRSWRSLPGLIGDAERYLARPTSIRSRDGASYSLAGLWLSDAELQWSSRARLSTPSSPPRLANGPETRSQPAHPRDDCVLSWGPAVGRDPSDPTPRSRKQVRIDVGTGMPWPDAST